MDHVSANKTLSATERENISGARVFDGEDQGKFIIFQTFYKCVSYFKNLHKLQFY